MSIPPPSSPASTPTPAPFCARCGAPNDAGLAQCPHCGQSLLAAWPPPPPVYYPPSAGGGLNALIPANNPSALAAYYLGIFSIIPCLAIPMGIAAVVLGVRGLKLFQAHPEVRGRTHAWVGIIAGGFFALLNLAGILFVVIASHSQAGS